MTSLKEKRRLIIRPTLFKLILKIWCFQLEKQCKESIILFQAVVWKLKHKILVSSIPASWIVNFPILARLAFEIVHLVRFEFETLKTNKDYQRKREINFHKCYYNFCKVLMTPKNIFLTQKIWVKPPKKIEKWELKLSFSDAYVSKINWQIENYRDSVWEQRKENSIERIRMILRYN